MTDFWWNTVLIMIISIYAVESFKSLWSWSPTTSKDVTDHCGKWWDKARNYGKDDHEVGKREYIDLILRNCPGLVTVFTTASAKFPYKQHVEISHTQQAVHSLTHESVIIHKKEARELCAEEDGGDGDCYFWWSTARWAHDKANVRYDCVNQIMKYCANLVSKVHEERKIVHINGKSANQLTETFAYKGQQEQVVVIRFAPVHLHSSEKGAN